MGYGSCLKIFLGQAKNGNFQWEAMCFQRIHYPSSSPETEATTEGVNIGVTIGVSVLTGQEQIVQQRQMLALK